MSLLRALSAFPLPGGSPLSRFDAIAWMTITSFSSPVVLSLIFLPCPVNRDDAAGPTVHFIFVQRARNFVRELRAAPQGGGFAHNVEDVLLPAVLVLDAPGAEGDVAGTGEIRAAEVCARKNV